MVLLQGSSLFLRISQNLKLPRFFSSFHLKPENRIPLQSPKPLLISVISLTRDPQPHSFISLTPKTQKTTASVLTTPIKVHQNDSLFYSTLLSLRAQRSLVVLPLQVAAPLPRVAGRIADVRQLTSFTRYPHFCDCLSFVSRTFPSPTAL